MRACLNKGEWRVHFPPLCLSKDNFICTGNTQGLKGALGHSRKRSPGSSTRSSEAPAYHPYKMCPWHSLHLGSQHLSWLEQTLEKSTEDGATVSAASCISCWAELWPWENNSPLWGVTFSIVFQAEPTWRLLKIAQAWQCPTSPGGTRVQIQAQSFLSPSETSGSSRKEITWQWKTQEEGSLGHVRPSGLAGTLGDSWGERGSWWQIAYIDLSL